MGRRGKPRGGGCWLPHTHPWDAVHSLASCPSCQMPHPGSALGQSHLLLFPFSSHLSMSLPPGLESRARKNMCATSLTAARPSGRPPCCGPMCACTPASGPSSATGSSAESGSHGATSCSGTPAPTQVSPHLPPTAAPTLPAMQGTCHTEPELYTDPGPPRQSLQGLPSSQGFPSCCR